MSDQTKLAATATEVNESIDAFLTLARAGRNRKKNALYRYPHISVLKAAALRVIEAIEADKSAWRNHHP